MTNTFKNASADPVPNTATVIYTCPASTQAIVHNIHLAATDPSISASATIKLFSSGASALRTLGVNLPIPVGGALEFDKPVNLQVGDQIQVTAGATNTLAVVLSILEIS